MRFLSHQVFVAFGCGLQLPIEIRRNNRRIAAFDAAPGLALLAGVVLGAGAAAAATPERCKIDMKIDRVYAVQYLKMPAPAALVTLAAGPRCGAGFAMVSISCTWLDQTEKPVATGQTLFQNVRPGVPATEQVSASGFAGVAFASARCRVVTTRR